MSPTSARRARPLLLLLLAGCSSEPLLHGLDEAQANELLVALDEGGVEGEKQREEGGEGGWVVAVRAGEAAAARRVLAERELPRPRAPGFGDVFAGGGMVPTPVEEHARYLHALSGELSRSLESLDGVVEARVHLGLPLDDPLRPGEPRPPRAAVLLRCRPAACAALRGNEAGIRSLVAGAADGLTPDAVSILVADAAPPPARASASPRARGWRKLAALALAVAAASLAAFALRRQLRWTLRRPDAA
jgi:type III secretion protein J